MTNPGLRASDADRQHVVAALERHTTAGRLTLDEFGERVARTLAATTHGDLAAVTSDLPADPPPADHPAEQATHAQARQLAVAFLLAVVVLAVIGVILAVAR